MEQLIGETAFPHAAEEVLAFLRSHFGFGIWMVSRIEGNDWIVLRANGGDDAPQPGYTFSFEESYCRRMIEGEGPKMAPDCRLVPAYNSRPVKAGVYVGMPLYHPDGHLFGTLCAIDDEPQPESITRELPLLEILSRLLTHLLKAEILIEAERRILERTKTEATTDPLTGILNRRGWDVVIDLEEARCRDYGNPAVVMAIDLDGLKQVNDTLGHAAGDELIIKTAKTIPTCCRAGDCVARVGGDEFWVLMTDCEEKTAADVTDRIRTGLATAGVSASIGYARRNPASGLREAMAMADAAMYAEKRGRKAGI